MVTIPPIKMVIWDDLGNRLWHFFYPHYINFYTFLNWLVVSAPLKNMKVRWGDYSQYMEKS